MFTPVLMEAGELADAISAARPLAGPRSAWANLANFIRLALTPDSRFELSEAVALADADSRIAWACLALLNPGRTSLLVMGPPPAALLEPDAQPIADMLALFEARQRGRGVRLLQALLPEEQRFEAAVLASAAYTRLADLDYMEGPLPRADDTPMQADEVIAWDASAEPLFARLIERTYRGTLDCPGLEGLRRMEDVMAGHRGSGRFTPELWFCFGRRESPSGVVLLNELLDRPGAGVELVYMGVAPEARGQGLGRRFLLHASGEARRHGYRQMLLAVDAKNAPAIRLYRNLGLRETIRRVAFIKAL